MEYIPVFVLLLGVGILIGILIRQSAVKSARLETEAANSRTQDAETQLAVSKAELDSQSQQKDAFKSMASDVLKDSQEELLKRNKEFMDERAKLTHSDIKGIVAPVDERLKELKKQVQDMEEKREGAYAGLTTQVGQLSDLAGGLRDVMKSGSMRGSWGEQHLANVLEMSGLTSHVDYDTQVHIKDPDTQKGLRPDAVITMPNGAQVVIDAKTPHAAYAEAVSCDDDNQQQALLKKHATDLLDHAKKLNERKYQDYLDGSPDFTVMYVPTDPMLDAAMDAKPDLWDEALRAHNVVIATPGVLLVLLRTVALAWRQQELQENADKIAKAGHDLYKSVRTFSERFEKVGSGLTSAINSYNSAVTSFQGQQGIARRAITLQELGAVPATDDPIADIEQVTKVAESVQVLESGEIEAGD